MFMPDDPSARLAKWTFNMLFMLGGVVAISYPQLAGGYVALLMGASLMIEARRRR